MKNFYVRINVSYEQKQNDWDTNPVQMNLFDNVRSKIFNVVTRAQFDAARQFIRATHAGGNRSSVSVRCITNDSRAPFVRELLFGTQRSLK